MTLKKINWKPIIIVLTIGVIGYVLCSVYKAFVAGERTILGLAMAPFNALGSVWTSITGLFSGSGLSLSTPQPVTLPSGAVVATNSPLYSLVAPPAQANEQTMINDWLGGPSVVSGDGSLINPATGTVDWNFSGS